MSEALSSAINALIDDGLQVANAAQAERDYFGASEGGQFCERRLAYSYHGEKRPPFPGRPLRRFRMGHWAEDETVDWMRAAGFKIEHSQAGFALLPRGDGSFEYRGHIDGVVKAGPEKLADIAMPYPCLFEHKIMKAAIWRASVKHGIEVGHPTYYAQVQIYMRQMGLAWCLFAYLNTDTSELHFELIPYKSEVGEALTEKVARILASKDPREFARLAQVSTDVNCKFCPYQEACWATPVVAAPKPLWMR